LSSIFKKRGAETGFQRW